ncbi:MAG: crossover junction endodeoxyribonuclease RuvC [Deltaproteobacteria bacterium]|nr:crossover junction endodeoxyribonuclease RuvC [Deltaproteobacteria bacterium]
MSRVIGIDPGSSKTGFGIVDKTGHHLRHVDSGIIRLKSSQTLSDKLLSIHLELTSIIAIHKPDVLAIEEVFYAKNVRSAMVLSHARAAVLLTAALQKLPVFEYAALEVKRATTSYGRASKEQVFEMIKRLLNLQNQHIQSMDQTDALAIAICHLNTFALEQKIVTENSPHTYKGTYRT